MTAAVFVFGLLLAAVNGSNDDAKGVATLGGAGVATYRRALAWGVAATLVGSLLSTQLAGKLTKLFSSGIVTARPSSAFALAVLVGATAWVMFATVTRLPVSTTHALVGALVGAGLVLGSRNIAWSALTPKVVEPLLLSIAVAYGLSAVLNLLPGSVPECVCVAVDQPVAITAAPGTLAVSTNAFPSVRTGTIQDCQAHGVAGRGIAVTLNGMHWLSAGAASLARGLNDTPKIVAVAAFALVPAGMSATALAGFVAVAMAIGGMLGGMRVAHRLGDDVVAMNAVEGAKANLVAATLVGLGATNGLPMSLTHVSTGAIGGASGGRPSRLNGRTLREFAVAWTITPLAAGAVAALTFAVVR